MGVNKEQGKALTLALDNAKAQFFTLCQQVYCHVRNMNVSPIETFCRRTQSNEVECTQYVKVSVLDQQFDPNITDAHHVDEMSVSIGKGFSNWTQPGMLIDDEVSLTGNRIRLAYSFSQFVSLGVHYLYLQGEDDLTGDEVEQTGLGMDAYFYPKGYNQGLYLGMGAGVRNYKVQRFNTVLLDEETQFSYGLLGLKKYFSAAFFDVGLQADTESIDEFSSVQFFALFGVGF